MPYLKEQHTCMKLCFKARQTALEIQATKLGFILMNKESNSSPLRREALLITSEENEASQMCNLTITEASQIKQEQVDDIFSL